MKKLFFVALAVVGMTLSSCGGVESKAESYVEQMVEAAKAGDFTKCYELEQESTKWFESLSPEDREKAEAAAEAATKKFAEECGVQL